MKKVKLIIGSLFIAGLILFNLSLMANKTDVLSNFNLASLHQAFAYDLEEVTITCSSGSYGQCYGVFGGYCYDTTPPWDIWSTCSWTGIQSDYCDSDQEFDDCGGAGNSLHWSPGMP